ncbi:DUF305 domain-containing protein [Nocardioides sp.]|uniref:Ferritin-related protein n=1 Tax=metagenome TaxID=256318 RepID=A0A2P2BX59_9ZZZZ
MWLPAAVLLLAVAVAAGMLLGARLDNEATNQGPTEGSVDVGFLRDMQEHHAQAVEMSVLIRERTKDPEILRLALDIELSQQQQIGQMYGWLAERELAQSASGPPMQWLAQDQMMEEPHDMGDSSSMPADMTVMPGMASDADLTRLTSLPVGAAERLYLQLMVPHHQGGVEMARYAVSQAKDSHVRRLAQRILEAQDSEIEALKSMLSARGGPVT